MIRVAIIDDHVMIREGLKKIIEHESDIRVMAEAGSSAEALQILREYELDVLVLDISLPDKNGIEVLKDIKRNSKLPVLMLSMYPEERYGVRAIQAGAAGYLTKETASQELIKAIRLAYRGKRYVPPPLGEALANQAASGNETLPHKTLSDREFEIMSLIATGKTRMEIAQKLNLSPATVSTYRRRVLQKLGITTSVELFKYALENHLLE